MSFYGMIHLSKITILAVHITSYQTIGNFKHTCICVDLLLTFSYPVIQFAIRHSTCACTHVPNPSQLVQSGGEHMLRSKDARVRPVQQ